MAGSGEVVTCSAGKKPLKLIREICVATPAIQPDHIGYLGIELQKANNALKNIALCANNWVTVGAEYHSVITQLVRLEYAKGCNQAYIQYQ